LIIFSCLKTQKINRKVNLYLEVDKHYCFDKLFSEISFEMKKCLTMQVKKCYINNTHIVWLLRLINLIALKNNKKHFKSLLYWEKEYFLYFLLL